MRGENGLKLLSAVCLGGRGQHRRQARVDVGVGLGRDVEGKESNAKQSSSSTLTFISPLNEERRIFVKKESKWKT